MPKKAFISYKNKSQHMYVCICISLYKHIHMYIPISQCISLQLQFSECSKAEVSFYLKLLLLLSLRGFHRRRACSSAFTVTHTHLHTHTHSNKQKKYKYKHMYGIAECHAHTARTFLLFDCVFIYVISAVRKHVWAVWQRWSCGDCSSSTLAIFYSANILLQTLCNFNLNVNRFSFDFYDHFLSTPFPFCFPSCLCMLGKLLIFSIAITFTFLYPVAAHKPLAR